ncbi:MAG TPA: ABC transporter permease [Gemmatimonadaceae bacterium]|nr:ABC transporter permease [Gemmatimonadaceae bacterium]
MTPTPNARDRYHGWRRRLRALFQRRAAEREMSAELAFHLDMETENNVRLGMSPDAARRAAMLAFGGVDRFSEDVRDTRNVTWLEDLRHDLRHAIRGFRRSPGFTIAAVAALSLGIGANTAVFSVVHAVVIAGLPYPGSERLVRLWESSAAQHVERGTVSPGTFGDLRARSRTLERLAMYGERDFLISDGDETWQSRAAAISPALFEMLGTRPYVGRLFPPDDGPSPYAGTFNEIVISHELWQRRFGGDSSVIGRTIRVDGRWAYTIVGVAQPRFAYPAGVEIWTPLAYSRSVAETERQFRYYDVVAKLRAGHTIQEAERETAAIAAQLGTEYPASNAGWTVELASLRDTIVGDTRSALLVVFGLAVCVLLVAGGNVATLAVARAASRRHETAVRLALGAANERLLRQWIAEGLLLATLGGLGGVAIGYLSGQVLIALAPSSIPRLNEVAFTTQVIIFSAIVTLVTGIAVGLAPALRARDARLIDAMRSRTASGAGGVRTREWLVGAQVAVTLVLTVAAALLFRSFERLQSTDLGYRRHDIISAQIRVAGGRFTGPTSWYQRVLYYDEMMTALGRIPGVRSVAGTTNVPLTGDLGAGSMWRADAPGAHGRQPPTSAADQWKGAIQIVTPSYFGTMGIPVVRGRDFTPADRFERDVLVNLQAPRPPGVAIINEAMAKRFWPDRDPLGSTIVVFDDLSFASSRTIVGVVRDVRAELVQSPASPSIFLPLAQHPGRGLSLVLRTDLPPDQLTATVTNRLRAFDSAISVTSVSSLDAVVDSSLSKPRFTLMLVAGFAVLALAIAGIGVFGIVAFLVARRTQEIGIRVALGAQRGSVLWLVVREGLRPVVSGVAVGCLGGIAVARAMRAVLYGLAPLDLVSFAAAVALLLAASLLAAAVPARRATSVDPLRSLRSE